jgi:predicted O-linked N-acetylglucosamine transferase (SPINDLY family)
LKALITLYKTARYAELESQSQKLIGEFPDAGILWKLLGASLNMQTKDALHALQKTAELLPNDAEAHNNLGIALQERGQLDAAMSCHLHALKINPDFVEAHYNLGNVLCELEQLSEAVKSYRNGLKLNPNFAILHSNLGSTLLELGLIEEALVSYRHALTLDPNSVVMCSNLIGILNYTTSTPAEYLSEALRYGQIAACKVTQRFTTWRCDFKPQHLRIGIVSGDFRNHPIGFFLESLLAQLNPARIELIAYTTQTKEDYLTNRIKPYFTKWQSLFGLSDQAAAKLIHDDGVHILIDLSGHTAHNRLPVFAYKPAPVQASWLGYFASTGVTEIDYFLADETGVPDTQPANFSETVCYLPDTRLCFTPPLTNLPIAPLPSLKNGHITFGCFQNLAKLGDKVLMAWGRIFAALPTARLRLASKQLGDPTVVSRLVERLQQYGIAADRVQMLGSVPRAAYLAAHAEVDIILDTFPYPGGTTTCEALWMGVPTLTLAGETLLARQGASLLTAAGLPDWITNGEDDYVAKAIHFASDLPKLTILRAGLREQVRTSPLFDAPRFAKNLEDALWEMWQIKVGNAAAINQELTA